MASMIRTRDDRADAERMRPDACLTASGQLCFALPIAAWKPAEGNEYVEEAAQEHGTLGKIGDKIREGGSCDSCMLRIFT
jgi:hypothetical protein